MPTKPATNLMKNYYWAAALSGKK